MRRLKALVLGLLLAPQMALAQAQSCNIPDNIAPARVEPRPVDEPPRHTPVAGYVLALSWSPEFCRNREGSKRDRVQCSGEHGRFGFILHGLWPEASHSAYPRYCKPATAVPGRVVRTHLCMTPSVDLLQHEWAKHGSCGWRAPKDYYRAASLLWNALRIPEMERLSRSNPTAGEVRTAFAAINPGLSPDTIRVIANRRQWLREVHLCLGRDFKPRACPNFVKGVADPVPIAIWRGQAPTDPRRR